MMVTICACLLSLSMYHTLLSVCGRITVHCVTYNGLLALHRWRTLGPFPPSGWSCREQAGMSPYMDTTSVQFFGIAAQAAATKHRLTTGCVSRSSGDGAPRTKCGEAGFLPKALLQAWRQLPSHRVLTWPLLCVQAERESSSS